MDAIQHSAKALVAAALAAGAAWVSRRYGVDVPPEAQSLVTDLIFAGAAALLGGSITWLVPNKPA